VLSQTMPEPPPRARRELINGAMALVDRHLRLAEAESDGDFSAVDKWLASVMPESP